jgi:hypothetical protein
VSTFRLLIVSVALAGCDPTPVLFKAVAVGAPVVAAGYRSLDAADKDQQNAIRAEIKDDPQKAQADLNAHLKRYGIAAISLDTTMATMQTALDSVPALKAAHDKKATMDLVSTLFKLYEDVRQELAPLGIDVPKVTP